MEENNQRCHLWKREYVWQFLCFFHLESCRYRRVFDGLPEIIDETVKFSNTVSLVSLGGILFWKSNLTTIFLFKSIGYTFSYPELRLMLISSGFNHRLSGYTPCSWDHIAQANRTVTYQSIIPGTCCWWFYDALPMVAWRRVLLVQQTVAVLVSCSWLLISYMFKIQGWMLHREGRSEREFSMLWLPELRQLRDTV